MRHHFPKHDVTFHVFTAGGILGFYTIQCNLFALIFLGSVLPPSTVILGHHDMLAKEATEKSEKKHNPANPDQLNVLLTMHYDINFIPVTNLMHKFLYSYNVIILYMFRAVLCSSSGGQIVCIQHMVSSLSMSGRAVHDHSRLYFYKKAC